jgi:hypothetical protein
VKNELLYLIVFSLVLVGCFFCTRTNNIEGEQIDSEPASVFAGNDTTVFVLDTLMLRGSVLSEHTIRQHRWLKKRTLGSFSGSDSVIAYADTVQIIGPAEPCSLTYVYRVYTMANVQSSDTMIVYVINDTLFYADGGPDQTVLLNDTIHLSGSYGGIFSITSVKWQQDTSGTEFPTKELSIPMTTAPVSLLYRFIVTNTKGMTAIDTVFCNAVPDSSYLEVDAGNDIIAQPNTTVTVHGRYMGLGITDIWWSVNNEPFVKSQDTITVTVASDDNMIPCIFKVQNAKEIVKSDTAFIIIDKKDSLWVDAGPDMTVYLRMPVTLHATVIGKNVTTTAWKIGYNGFFMYAPCDTTFRAPSQPGKLPCIFRAQNNTGRTVYDTVIVNVIRDTTLPNGINFSSMSVTREKPYKITFSFLLLDDDGKFLNIPSNEMSDIFRIYEKGQSQNVFKEIDYTETSFFITENENFAMDVCLVFDFTKSMEIVPGAIDTMVSSARQLIDSLNMQSKISIVEYHDRNEMPTVLAPLSLNHDAAKTAVTSFANSSILHGSSRVWDAIYTGIVEFAQSTEKVRSLIVLTDGNETSSLHNVEELKTFALNEGVKIYPIAFGNVLTENYNVLKDLATVTGGKIYSATDVNDLSEMFKMISGSLGAQFAVSYISLQTAGKWDVKITAEYAHDSSEYIAKVNMDSISSDDRIGEIIIDKVDKNPLDSSAMVYVKANHVPRSIDHFEFTLNSPKTVSINLDEGLCRNWAVETLGANHFRISSPDPIQFGKFGLLWRMRIANIIGGGAEIPFSLKNDYSAGQEFVYPSFITIGSGGTRPIVEAGPDIITGMNDTVRLHGTAADPDSMGIIQYGWCWDSVTWQISSTADTFFISSDTIPYKDSTFICRFRAMNSDGVLGYDSLTITMTHMPPKAIPRSPDSNVGVNDSIRLIGSHSTDNDSIVKYEWRFGTDTSWVTVSGGDTVIVAPAQAASNYLCYLRVTDSDGERSTGYDYIRIRVQVSIPVAVPKALETTVGPGDTIHLVGSESYDSDGHITKYEWGFGDTLNWKTVSTGDTAIIAPSTPTADFRCYLKVTDDDNCTSYGNTNVRITVYNATPVAVPNVLDASVGLNDTIHLVGSGSYDSDGQITKYEWGFGDTLNWKTVSTGDTAVIAPSTPTADYRCYLRVTDDDNAQSSANNYVKIKVNSSPPTAVLQTSGTAFGLYDTIRVTGSTSSDNDGYIAKYEWKFGTGPWTTVSTGDTDICPLVVDTAYTCSLRVTDDDNETDTRGRTVQINLFTLLTDQAEFTARYGHITLAFNDAVWLIGGYDGSLKNDVWQSADGKTWTNATTAAPFPARYFHAGVVFDNKMWVIGGDGSPDPNDIWYSSDGVVWDSVTTSAPFGARYGHTCLVFNNKLWIIAGRVSGNYYNDVWFTDDGVTWDTATMQAPFPGRYSHTSLVYNNKMWVIGGNNGGSYLNDVWYSDDGVVWTQATAHAQFPIRAYHSSVVYDSLMFVIGGYGSSYYQDVWCSADGVSWLQADDTAGFGNRSRHSSIVHQNRILVINGYSMKTDVWYYKKP